MFRSKAGKIKNNKKKLTNEETEEIYQIWQAKIALRDSINNPVKKKIIKKVIKRVPIKKIKEPTETKNIKDIINNKLSKREQLRQKHGASSKSDNEHDHESEQEYEEVETDEEVELDEYEDKHTEDEKFLFKKPTPTYCNLNKCYDLENLNDEKIIYRGGLAHFELLQNKYKEIHLMGKCLTNFQYSFDNDKLKILYEITRKNRTYFSVYKNNKILFRKTMTIALKTDYDIALIVNGKTYDLLINNKKIYSIDTLERFEKIKSNITYNLVLK